MSAPESVQGTVLYPKTEEGKAVYKTVAVVGPPNAGKTTLFNRLTGLRQRVGNFPGVTVEHHTGSFRLDSGEEVALIDLPGVYSLNPKSEDEKVTVDVLNGDMPGTEHPDAIILVLDSNNLNRHLVLAGRVIALGLPTLVLLNMADELHKQGGQVDVLPLARQLGTPVALVSAVTGEGIEAVANFLVATPQAARAAGAADLRRSPPLPRMGGAGGLPCRLPARRNSGVDPPPGFDLPAQTLGRSDLSRRYRRRLPDHFRVGQPASDLLQKLLDTVAVHLSNLLPPGIINSLVVNGVWKGAGSVLVFLPQILLLFLVIGILEDSGYLARAAVISDKVMARVGPERKVVHPSAFGLRMRRASHYGHAHH